MKIQHQANGFKPFNIAVQSPEELKLLLSLFGGLSEDMVKDLTGDYINDQFAYNVYGELNGIAVSYGIDTHKQINIKVVKY